MNPKQFFYKVARMRELQKKYFRTRTGADLRVCKQIEKEIDDEIERVNKIVKEEQNPKLNF